MKHNVFGLAAAVAVSLAGVGAASAADMAVKARPMPVAVYSWTGCYIGVSAGGKWARAEDSVVIPAAGPAPFAAVTYTAEPSTWLAGGQAGCNMQSGNWVFGVEADAHAQRWSSLRTLGAGFPAPFVTGDQYGLSSDWQASVRGRVGYAMDRTLFYVTGGVAFTEIKSYTNWIPGVFGINPPVAFPGTIAYDKQIAFGGTVGAGIEYAWTNNFTVGVEGRYTWYGTERLAAGPLAVAAVIGAAPTFVFSNTYRDVRLETGEILVKANWKFGPGAVVAKY
jgi:outer membrane immunogenic protein